MGEGTITQALVFRVWVLPPRPPRPPPPLVRLLLMLLFRRMFHLRDVSCDLV